MKPSLSLNFFCDETVASSDVTVASEGALLALLVCHCVVLPPSARDNMLQQSLSSFDRLLWSACLPSSLARDRPNRFPRTLASPDAQEQVPNACTGLSPRRRHWRPLEFLARADVLDVSRSRETSKTSERSAGDRILPASSSAPQARCSAHPTAPPSFRKRALCPPTPTVSRRNNSVVTVVWQVQRCVTR